jgi:hypothetical protein
MGLYFRKSILEILENLQKVKKITGITRFEDISVLNHLRKLQSKISSMAAVIAFPIQDVFSVHQSKSRKIEIKFSFEPRF